MSRQMARWGAMLQGSPPDLIWNMEWDLRASRWREIAQQKVKVVCFKANPWEELRQIRAPGMGNPHGMCILQPHACN